MKDDESQTDQTVGQRLRAARLLLGISQSQVAARAGVSQVSIQHLESGRNENSRHLIHLAEAVGVRPEWLLTGKNPMTANTPQPSVADDDAYAIVQYETVKLSKSSSTPDSPEASRGIAFKRSWLESQGLIVGNLAAAICEEMSNSPTIDLGDAFVFDRSQKVPQPGKLYAILSGANYIVRRFRSGLKDDWLVGSDNPDKGRYPDIVVSNESVTSMDIRGRVVWRGGAL